jgi:hypothetical protein
VQSASTSLWDALKGLYVTAIIDVREQFGAGLSSLARSTYFQDDGRSLLCRQSHFLELA